MGDHARPRKPARHRKPSIQARAAAATAAAATGTATAGVVILASHAAAASPAAHAAFSYAAGVNEVSIARTEEKVIKNTLVLHLEHWRHEVHLRNLALAEKEKAQQAQQARLAASRASVPRVSYAPGVFSYGALKALWVSAGGPAWAANVAACIAMHESGGRSNAISPTNDYGLFQINGSHGAMATLNPFLNAVAAVQISSHGTNWGAWTTHWMCGV